jgi:hypothetical protein
VDEGFFISWVNPQSGFLNYKEARMKHLIDQLNTTIQRAAMLLAGQPGNSQRKAIPVSTGRATRHSGRV